ncbi:MAG: sulfatase-like hydrolase/transferase, partial [FCB group bacterium]|nr:sulfatase-like hydrolase/transferase [FCB group bacterium]
MKYRFASPVVSSDTALPSSRGFASSLAAVILSLAVSAATADAWISLAAHTQGRVSFGEVSRSAAAVFVAALIGCVLLCAVAALAARALGLKARPLAEAAVLWAALMFLFLLPFDGVQLGLYREGNLSAFVALGLALVVSTLVAVRAYPGTIRMRFLYAALPVLLLVGAVWYWMTHHRPVDPRHGWLAAGAAVGVAAGLLYAARFGTSSARMTCVLGAIGMGILFAPVSGTWGGEPVRAALTAPSTVDHKVSRVILITIDSLRRDALGCYGSGRNDTPRIDEFAGEGLRFTRAYSAAPWTLPSVASMMTGLAPFHHGVVTMANRLPEESVTFAERMLEGGYKTGG